MKQLTPTTHVRRCVKYVEEKSFANRQTFSVVTVARKAM